ncbi:COP9 signalosome complex subunit 9-like isoform X1 [Saccoglossus kowalevskii]
MKPSIVADEMFPEGGGPYVDLEEVWRLYFEAHFGDVGGSAGLLMDLAANEKAVHGDFFNGKYLMSNQMCSWSYM